MDRQQKISLNVHLQVPPPQTTDGSHTPNTPEILNTIVNMTSGGASNAGPFATEFQSLQPPPSTTSHNMIMQEQPTLIEQQAYYNTMSSLGNSVSIFLQLVLQVSSFVCLNE